MAYREPLPDDCPPDDAEEINALRIVYRLVRNNPPTDADFRSQRALYPDKAFRYECRARGLSVFENRQDAERQLELKSWHGARLCRVDLVPGAGRILKTYRNSHYTWWPLADFDILANCQVV